MYSKTCVKRPKIVFQDQLSLEVGQKYPRMLHLTLIELPFVIKIFVLSIFEWLFYTSLTVCKA